MRKGWLERAVSAFADAGSLYGMPPAYVEMIVLAERERRELEAQRADDAALAAPTLLPGIHDDDDEGGGGSHRERVPVAA